MRSPLISKELECIYDLDSDPKSVLRVLQTIESPDLNHLYYPYFALNTRSLLAARCIGDEILERASANVRSTAFQSWLYRAFLHKGTVHRPDLYPFDQATSREVESFLVPGQPAVIGSFHLGHSRYLCHVLASLGHKVLVSMDQSSYDEMDPLLKNAQNANPMSMGSPCSLAFTNVTFCSVELPSAALQMSRHLRNGGLLVIYLDGNSGLDGSSGMSSREIVSFGPYFISVKTGAARLSIRCGVPFVLMTAHHHCGIEPSLKVSTISGETSEKSFGVSEYMQFVWSRLYDLITDNEETWESLRFLHRWRKLAGDDERFHSDPDSSPDLISSSTLSVSPFMQKIDLEDGYAWINARNLCGFADGSAEASILDLLSNYPGSTLDELQSDFTPAMENFESVAFALASRGAVTPLSLRRPI